MQKVFIVDTDTQFQELVTSLCQRESIDSSIYSSSMEIFSLLGSENPQLILLDLEIPDLNDFVMHDLLKKANVTYSIPVIITYSEQSENALEKYSKLQYKAEEYLKKPVSGEQLEELLKKHITADTAPEEISFETPADNDDLEITLPEDFVDVDAAFDLHEADDSEIDVQISTIPGIDEVPADDEFSDEQIDRLVRGDLNISEEKDDKESTNPFAEVMADTKENLRKNSSSGLDIEEPEEDLGFEKQLEDSFKDEPFLESAEPPEKEVSQSRAVRELENQLVSLERQNEFLRAENKELTEKNNTLESSAQKNEEEMIKLKGLLDQMRENSGHLQGQLDGLNQEMSQQLETLKQEKEQLENECSSLKEEKFQLNEKCDSTQSEKEQLTSLLDELKEQLNRLEEDKTSLRQQVEHLDQQTQTDQAEKNELQSQVQNLTSRLTDKEREVVALNHEFEKDLQVKSDELVQHTEERLHSEFKKREEQLLQQYNELQETTSQNESVLRESLDSLTKDRTHLEMEKMELTKREESLNRTVSNLAEEKVSLSEKIAALQTELNEKQQESEQKESQYNESIEKLNRQLEENQQQIADFKEKMHTLDGLFQQAASLTRNNSR